MLKLKKTVNFLKRHRKKPPKSNLFAYRSSGYSFEKEPQAALAIHHAFEFLKLLKNTENYREPCAPAHSYRLVDAKGMTIFTAHDNTRRIFPVKRPDKLIEDNLDVITAIFKVVRSGDTFFDENILPYIHRAAAMCLTLPASEGSHDALPGGLLRHLLCTALESINLTLKNNGTTDVFKQKCIKSAAFLAGLNHDLAKIFTDYTVYAGGYEFNPFLESLAHFCKRTNAQEYTLIFNSPRKGKHDELSCISLGYLTADQPQIFAYIDRFCPISDFYLQKGELFKHVKCADASCVRSCALHSDPYSFNVNSCLGIEIINTLTKTDFAELKKLGLFVVPDGLLISYDSLLLAELNSRARTISYGEENSPSSGSWQHLIIEWRRQGNIFLTGRQSVYSWHQLNKNGQKFLVYGATLKFKTKNLANHQDLLCNSLPLGPYPQALKTFLDKHCNDHFPGIISLAPDHPDFDDITSLCESEFLTENELESRLEKSPAGSSNGINVSNEHKEAIRQNRAAKLKEDQSAGQAYARDTVKELNFLNLKPEDPENYPDLDKENLCFLLPNDLNRETDCKDSAIAEPNILNAARIDLKMSRDLNKNISEKQINSLKKENSQAFCANPNNTKNPATVKHDQEAKAPGFTAKTKQKAADGFKIECWLDNYIPDLPQFNVGKKRKTNP